MKIFGGRFRGNANNDDGDENGHTCKYGYILSKNVVFCFCFIFSMANSKSKPTISGRGYLMDSVPLPCQLPTWNKIQSALQQLLTVSSTNDLLLVLGRVYQAAHPAQFSWHIQQPPLETAHPFVGLGHFLEHVASVSEQDTFFRRVLPTIAQLAGQIDKWTPAEGIPYSVQQQGAVRN